MFLDKEYLLAASLQIELKQVERLVIMSNAFLMVGVSHARIPTVQRAIIWDEGCYMNCNTCGGTSGCS